MSKKKWFEVTCVTQKTIHIYAEDEDEARDKAEQKLGAKWMADTAWEA